MSARLYLIVAGLFLVGAVLIALAHLRSKADRSTRRGDWIKYGVYFGIVTFMVALVSWSNTVIPLVLVTLLAFGAIELYRNFKSHFRKPLRATAVGSVLLVICLCHLLFAPRAAWQTDFALVFLLTCLTDAFSQLWGKLIGTVKLCPSISPGKTLEGMVFGLATVTIMAPSLNDLWPHASATLLAVLGLAVGCAATTGDLAFSMLKRRLGIKDFSSLIPGHGGVLDRFDSFVLAAPTFYWVQRWLGY